jgi:hypothetical protein
MAVFEHTKIESSLTWLFFLTDDTRCHIDTYSWYPNKNYCFGIPKAGHYSM